MTRKITIVEGEQVHRALKGIRSPNGHFGECNKLQETADFESCLPECLLARGILDGLAVQGVKIVSG